MEEGPRHLYMAEVGYGHDNSECKDPHKTSNELDMKNESLQ